MSNNQNTPTIAQRISAQLNDDGQRFSMPDGTTLDELCDAAGGRREDRLDTRALCHYCRWVFLDESVIICQIGYCWDYGFIDCWCMQEGLRDHDDRCTRVMEEERR